MEKVQLAVRLLSWTLNNNQGFQTGINPFQPQVQGEIVARPKSDYSWEVID